MQMRRDGLDLGLDMLLRIVVHANQFVRYISGMYKVLLFLCKHLLPKMFGVWLFSP